MTVLLGLFQLLTPGDCVLTGLCGVVKEQPPLPPGIMFLALGAVAIGALGLFAHRRRHIQP